MFTTLCTGKVNCMVVWGSWQMKTKRTMSEKSWRYHVVIIKVFTCRSPCHESLQLQASSKLHNSQPDISSGSVPPSSLTIPTVAEAQSNVGISEVEMPTLNSALSMDSHQQVPGQFHFDTFHDVMCTKEDRQTSFHREDKRLLEDSLSRETVCAESNPIATNDIAHVPPTPTASSISQRCEADDCDNGSNKTRSDQPICILCDEPATVRLLPCGHQIICLMCSKRAKKCLQCKVITWRFTSWRWSDLFYSLCTIQKIVTARVNLSALWQQNEPWQSFVYAGIII